MDPDFTKKIDHYEEPDLTKKKGDYGSEDQSEAKDYVDYMPMERASLHACTIHVHGCCASDALYRSTSGEL